ncbi:MAG: hypothetical protein KDA80_16855 [Planctomycetaceae bacterium]|nr:hypothetical protein [Planctomycetaceae bacterium]
MRPKFLLAALALFVAAIATTQSADAAYRQYYSGWNYYPQRNYHYTTYYYKPTPTYQSYNYHYCISYPSQPRYVYYYNPHKGHYWGRFDCQGAAGAQYSLLKEADRKPQLEQIPETAFPKPAGMPQIPDSTDNTAIQPPPAAPQTGDAPAAGSGPPASAPPTQVTPPAAPPAAPPGGGAPPAAPPGAAPPGAPPATPPAPPAGM